MYFLFFLALSSVRWGPLRILSKRRGPSRYRALELVLLIVQVLVGVALENSSSALSGFGFVLVVTSLLESVYFRRVVNNNL